ncbi:MAG TPA: type II secretion system F family protein [Clostridia bacterium]|nr:type II secretion system F family protein [Clostridia bacterium]
MPDYDCYEMKIRERVIYTAAAAAVIFAVAFIFYRSFILSALLTPLALFYPRIKKREIIQRRKKELNIQFKDMLYSLCSSLSAGKTVESAFREALKDLTVLYPEPSAFILTELRGIIGRLDMNEPLETALRDFAGRARLEDIDNFVNVFNISKRSGGNLAEVIRNTSSIINDRIEVCQEVDMMLAERKFEQKVLNVIPILLIFLLSASAPDYMNPVFDTLTGRVTMSVSIVLLAVAWLISGKICDIKL